MPKRNWGVWGVWFGAGLLFWVATSAEGYIVNFILITPGYPPPPIPLVYTVALGTWDIVLDLVLMPFVGYFVQQRLKSFDLTGIFAMTLAAGLLVGIAPMTISQVCTTNASPTCSYQFDLGMYGQSYDVVYALASALSTSLVMLAGAFLSQWRRGAIMMANHVRSKNILLAAWLVIGFVAVGAWSAADASENLVFGGNYLLFTHGTPDCGIAGWWAFCQVPSLPSALVTSCTRDFMGRHEATVFDGGPWGMIAYVITQASRGIALTQMASLVIGTINRGVFTTWLVLSGCLLSIFVGKGAIKSAVYRRLHSDSGGLILIAVGLVITMVGIGFWVANGSSFTTPPLGDVAALQVADAMFSLSLILGVPCIIGGYYLYSQAAGTEEKSDSTKEDLDYTPNGQK